MSTSPVQEFTYISDQGIFTSTAHPDYKLVTKGDADVKSFKYSPTGKYLVLVKQKWWEIINAVYRYSMQGTGVI